MSAGQDGNAADDEVARHFEAELRRRTIVATTRTPSGQILDWVPIESQVPGGVIATPPPEADSPAPALGESGALARFELHDERVDRGPAGTVPIVRKDLSRTPVTGSLARYLRKGSPRGTTQPEAPDPGASFIHCTNAITQDCWGGDAVLNVWTPRTATYQDHSLMQLGLQNWDKPQEQSVEAGWIVCQQLNGDAQPHIFSYYTTNGHGPGANNVGGYNREFSGWVQHDANIFPGALLSPPSTPGGTQAVISIKFQWYNGNWWLQVQGTWLGYYPTSLFMGNQSVFGTLGDHAEWLGFWGEVGTVQAPASTTTQMGSGRFAGTGWQQACYQSNLRIQTDRSGSMGVFTGAQSVDNASLYDMNAQLNSGSAWASYFYAGGPGAI